MKKSQIINKISLFPLLIILLSCRTAIAEEYIIGVEKLNFLPYYSGLNGEFYGYARELLDAFGKDYGHRFKYNPLPVERLFQAFINGRVDLKFPDSPNWQQSLKQGNKITYSHSVAPFVDGIMMTPQRFKDKNRTFEKLGTIRGFTPWPYHQKIQQGKVVVSENNSIPGLLMQTVLNRVEGSYINVAVARYHLKNVLKKPHGLVFNPELAHDQGDYFLSTIKHPKLIRQFNSWLLTHSLQVEDLQKKWNIVNP